MLNAITAETLKLRKHLATWWLVWIFPIMFGIGSIAQLIRDIVVGPPTATPALAPAMWIQQTKVAVWGSPLSGGGRFILAGFAAVVFAGEYGWNTWKLIVPTRSRWQLVLAKWIVAFAFFFLALMAADSINLGGAFLRSRFGGPPIPSGVTLPAVWTAHISAGVSGLLPIVYTIIWASFFAVLTRSMLATVMCSIAIVMVEQLIIPLALLSYAYAPSLTSVVLHTLPAYHMANFIALTNGAGLSVPLGIGVSLAMTRLASIFVVLVWICAVTVATLVFFSRQDLN